MRTDTEHLDLIHQWYWMAILSDGTRVYQDDNEGSEWARLGLFLKDSQVGIHRFQVFFRGNVFSAPDNQAGYYFAKGTTLGMAGRQLDYYVVGWLPPATNEVQIKWVKVPELVVIHFFIRPLAQCPPPMLILNPPGLTPLVLEV